MTEKKTKKTTVKKKVIKLSYQWKNYELDVNEPIPVEFLKTKMREWQDYIPVWIYREVLRQLWNEFWDVKFSDPEIVREIKVQNNVLVLYKQECFIERWKRILKWSWYHTISLKSMASEAAHGNFKTLEAKAMRDCLKYAYRIFEFPDEDFIPSEDEIEKKIKEAEDVVKEVKKDTEEKKKFTVENVVKEIEKEKNKNEEKKEWDKKIDPLLKNAMKVLLDEEIKKLGRTPTTKELALICKKIVEEKKLKKEEKQHLLYVYNDYILSL